MAQFVWAMVLASPLLGLVSTLLVYVLVAQVYQRLGGPPWANPVFWSVLVLVALLALLGLLPMALSTGVGSETQRPFASVIVGGMVVLPLVALVLLPVLYALLGPKNMLTQEERDESAQDE